MLEERTMPCWAVTESTQRVTSVQEYYTLSDPNTWFRREKHNWVPRDLRWHLNGLSLTTILQVAVTGAKTQSSSSQSQGNSALGHADSTKFLKTSQTIAANPLILRTMNRNSHKAFRPFPRRNGTRMS
jgi:hypothetical protein